MLRSLFNSLYFITVIITGIILPTVRTTGNAQCGEIPYLNVVPGFGWDSLTSEDMNRVLHVSYKKCKTTNDGKFIIPDQAEDLTRENDETLETEVISKPSEYTPLTGRGFESSIEIPEISLYGTFSKDYLSLKERLAIDKTVTVRSSVRKTVYRIEMKDKANLTKRLKYELMHIFRVANDYNSKKFEYLAQMLVRRYGTHFATRVDAGVIFLQDDQINYYFTLENRDKIIEAAKMAFYLEHDMKTSFDNDFWDEYMTNRSFTLTSMIGDANFTKGSTVNIDTDNLAAIDRSGHSLLSLIVERNFPDVPPQLILNSRDKLKRVIQNYYGINSYYGCTKRESKSYDFFANVDDTCYYEQFSSYEFGGVYQKCDLSSGSLYSSRKPPTKNNDCLPYTKFNPLTGAFSCPHKENYLYYKNDDHVSVSYVSCNSYPKKISTVGFLFGGLYSDVVDNIVTNEKTCPENYQTLTLFSSEKLTLCVSNRLKQAELFAIPFGGLISCKQKSYCDNGFVKRYVTSVDGCVIFYCIAPSADTSQRIHIIRPPYDEKPDDVNELEDDEMMYHDWSHAVDLHYTVKSFFCLILVYFTNYL